VSSLPEYVEERIRRHQLLPEGQAILVAVSGGPDSMALLHLLHRLAPSHRWRLKVAHLNHRLRGRSSDADERLVRRAAQALGLRLVVGQANVRQLAGAEKLSVEMAARKARHEFLARAAARSRCACIALAHHADDQVELFFLRLLRGTGAEGLAGMKWRNPSPNDPAITLVRPLLDLPKSALVDYAARMKIPFREDSTNASLEIQRNRIRHELLPLLRKNYQPALDRSILRLMEIVCAEAEFVTQAAEDWLARRRADASSVCPQESKRPGRIPARRGPAQTEGFDGLSLAVQRRCLQLQLLRLGVRVDFDLVEELRLNEDRPVGVYKNENADRREFVAVRNGQGLVQLRTLEPGARFAPDTVEVCLRGRAGEALFAGMSLRWRISASGARRAFRPAAGREFFDADRIGPRVRLRYWQPGDRYQPIGMAKAVKLQDRFTNQKILRDRRHRLIVAATATGEIFWVEGLRISERFKLTNSTTRRLLWRWQRL